MTEEKNVNGIPIDEKVAYRILKKIIIKENANLKTKDKSEGQMVKVIQDLIQEEVKCYSNQ